MGSASAARPDRARARWPRPRHHLRKAASTGLHRRRADARAVDRRAVRIVRAARVSAFAVATFAPAAALPVASAAAVAPCSAAASRTACVRPMTARPATARPVTAHPATARPGGPAFAAGAVRINEVLYDPAGADAGAEFVEFVNVGPVPVAVASLVLEFHNGAGGGWSRIWSGGGRTDSIAPGDVWAVGGERVAGATATAGFSLQNGPDALRLLGDGVVVDVVGYGGIDQAGAMETRGVPPVPAGRSIARVPDGVDTDDNAADFAARPPTPGRRNVPRRNATLERTGAPVQAVATGATVTLAVRVRSTGTDTLDDVDVAWFDSSAAGVERPVGPVDVTGPLAPGAVRELRRTVSVAAGYHAFVALARTPGDAVPVDDRVVVRVRAGRPPVRVSEVAADPPPGCPPFVELAAVGGDGADVQGWRVRDAAHAPSLVTRASRRVRPGAPLAIAADSVALNAWVAPGVAASRIVAMAGHWPRLDRTGGAEADSVIVLDAWGLVVDAVAYPEAPPGRSVERVNLFAGAGAPVWAPSAEPRGASPGRPGRVAVRRPPRRAAVVLDPDPFDAARGAPLRVLVGEAPGAYSARVQVFDTSGRRVVDLGRVAPLPAAFVWDGRDADGGRCAAGLFLVVCEFADASGRRVDVVRRVVGHAAR